MPERVAIPTPPIRWGAVDDPGTIREWVRKVAQAVIEILRVRPTGIYVANSPAQVTGDEDDYAHGQVDVLLVDATSGPHTFTGFDAEGMSPFWLLNVGSNAFNLGHQNTNSAETNRILSRTSTNVSVTAGLSVLLWHDEDTDRWRILGE